MDATTLYYFLSTMAQTMAPACGFLAAFALLRIQSWNAELDWAKARFREVQTQAMSAQDMFKNCYRGSTEGARVIIEERTVVGDHSWKEKKDARDAVDTCARVGSVRPKLVRAMWLSLLSSVVVIAVALVALALVPRMVNCPRSGTVVVNVELLLSLIWLGATYLVVRHAVSIEP